MVLILDGNSDIDANVWSEIGHMNCLRHFHRSTAVGNQNKKYEIAGRMFAEPTAFV